MIESVDELRVVIREFGSIDPDPGRVAEKILVGLSDEEAHLVAAVTLRDYVRHILAMPLPRGPQREYETASGKRTVSRRVARQIDHIEAELGRTVYGVDNEYKHYGDCGEADLLFMVASRKKKARELDAEAERLVRFVEAEADRHAVRWATPD